MKQETSRQLNIMKNTFGSIDQKRSKVNLSKIYKNYNIKDSNQNIKSREIDETERINLENDFLPIGNNHINQKSRVFQLRNNITSRESIKMLEKIPNNSNFINSDNNNPSNISNSNVKKVKDSLHRRYNSHSLINENNFLENISKLNLNDDNVIVNNNINNQDNILSNNGILKQNTPVVTFNRKKNTVSPLMGPKDKFIINNNSNNNFYRNAEVSNGNEINNYNQNRSKENETGILDIKFEIKSKNLQLPNLYSENEFRKINNNKALNNIKRNNNSVTPNKFFYNSPQLNNLVTKKDLNLDTSSSNGLKRFNYPSSTQILHNRMNKTPDFSNTNKSNVNSTNISYNIGKNYMKVNSKNNGIDSDNYISANSRKISSRQDNKHGLAKVSKISDILEDGNQIQNSENSYLNNNLKIVNSTNSNNSYNLNKNYSSGIVTNKNNNVNNGINLLNSSNNSFNSSQVKSNEKFLKKRLTIYENININSKNKNGGSEKKIEVINYSIKNSQIKEEEDIYTKNNTDKSKNLNDQHNNYNLNNKNSNNSGLMTGNNINTVINSGIFSSLNSYNSNSSNLNNNNDSKTNNSNNQNNYKNINNSNSTIPGNISQAYSGSNGHLKSNSKPNPSIKKCAVKSIAGKTDNGLRKTNQDNYLSMENILNCEEFKIYGVFDGHGTYGHMVSSALSLFYNQFYRSVENYTTKIPKYKGLNMENKKNNINYNFSQLRDTKIETIYNKLKENNYEIIRNSFFLAEDEISLGKFDVQFSGSTCVLVFCIMNKIICANTGDSRAIMISEHLKKSKNFISKSTDSFVICSLSHDHKPELDHEKARILASGGRVDKYNDNGIKSGPYRVWLKTQNYPGLAMSRSIGDLVAGSIGVTCEPEILEYEIIEETRFIIIASDGVWEFIDNRRAMNIVYPFYVRNDPEGACNALTKEAQEEWEKEDSVIDDITAVIIFL